MKPLVEPSDVTQESTGLAGRGEGIEIRGGHQHLHRHIERDDDGRPYCCQDLFCCVRIVDDVRLGHRSCVARHAECAAHDHHLLCPFHDSRLDGEGQGQVGQRPESHDGDLSRLGLHQVDDQLRRSGSVWGGREFVRGSITVAKPVFAVDERRRGMRRPEQRHAGADADRNLLSIELLEDSDVCSRPRSGTVPEDRSHGDDLDLGRNKCVEHRQGIVDSGVRVDDDFSHDVSMPTVRMGASTVNPRDRRQCATADHQPLDPRRPTTHPAGRHRSGRGWYRCCGRGDRIGDHLVASGRGDDRVAGTPGRNELRQ